MRRNVYLLLCILFVFGSYQAKADNPPTFTGGHNQSLTICQNSGATPINSLLAITDLDAGQAEVWSVVTGSTFGSLVGATSTFSSGGVTIPGGLSYTPATGFSGTDSFRIRITDGTLSDTTTIHVLVNPLPASISGTASICRGLTSTLSDGGSGTWTSSSFIATVDISSGVVTAVATGNATITYTLSTGCKTTRIVTVNPMPNPIGGSTFSVCSGFSVTLNDVGGGSWASVNNSIATINTSTGLLTGTGADTVTITYTLSSGCFASALVTVNQQPAPITGASGVCMGSSTSLIETIPGGIWSSSNTALATVAAGTVTGIASGSVTIVYTLGSCSASKTVAINSVAPILGNTTICVGGNTVLTNANGGGVWTTAITGVASVSTTGFVSGIAPGNSVITYSLPSGCFSSATMTVNPVPLPITGIAHICTGAATTFSDGDGGGMWTSSNTAMATVDAATGLATGIVTGTPTIVYSFVTGCKVTIALTVNPLPSPIGGTLSACSGQITNLFETGGGTWSSTNTSIASINSGTGVVSAIAAGASTITYTLPTGCAASAIVTVNQTPAAIAGASNLCLGAATILTESIPGGVWSSSNTTVASVSGGSITTFMGGVAAIVYTLGSCSASKTLTVSPISPVTGVTTMCVGASATLGNATPGGTWSSSSPGVAPVSFTGTVSGLAPGTSTVTYTLPSGCFSTGFITINPPPSPITGVAHVCVGAVTPLGDPDGGGSWTSSNSSIASINTSGLVTGLATGAPTITYTFSTGCKTTIVVTVNPVPSPIVGVTSVCTGAHTGLTESFVSGSWSSSNTFIATIASTGYVTGVIPGVTSITYTLPSGCVTTANVTVNPTPAPITGPASVCQGYTVTLADALAGGVWSSAATSISIDGGGIVTGLTSTPAPVQVSYAVGSCSVTRTIIVNPITPILGDTSICNGTATTLANAMAGTWSSSNTAIAAISSAGMVSGLSPGASDITYTFLTGCFITKTFIVNPVPGPIVGAAAVCMGATDALSDSVAGGTWSSSAYYIAGIDPLSGVLTATATGTVTVHYSLAAGCSVSATVVVHPVPTPISGPVYSCPGLMMSLNSPGGGTWTSGNTSIATIDFHTGYFHAVSSGTVTITYTQSGCTISSEITVNPLPSPIVGDSFVCSGSYDTLSDAGGGSWTTENQTVIYIDSATGVAGGHAAGTATVVYTLPVTGCLIKKDITVAICTEAVPRALANREISISPNPSYGDFVITGALSSAGDAGISLTITNMLGQVVYRNKAIARNGNINEHIQLGNNLAGGMYILTLQSGNETKAFHIVMQR